MATNTQFRILSIAALGLIGAGCENEYPPAPGGRSVEGTVYYAGDMGQFQKPMAGILAIPTFPPDGVPHAALFLTGPDFGDGPLPYRLENLPPYDYFVVGVVGEESSIGDSENPLGGYPSFCALTASTTGPVSVTDDEPATGIDIVVYDGAGASDPCNASASSACPDEGMASLVLDLRTMLTTADLGEDDRIVIGLNPTFPFSGIPAVFKLLAPPNIELPLSYVQNDVPPGSYAVFVCLDREGDHLLSDPPCSGPGDFLAAHDGGNLIELAAGKVVSVTFTLEDGASEPVTVADPAASCSD